MLRGGSFSCLVPINQCKSGSRQRIGGNPQDFIYINFINQKKNQQLKVETKYFYKTE